MAGQAETRLLAAANMLADSSRHLEHVAEKMESIAETQAAAIDRLTDKLGGMGGGAAAGGDKKDNGMFAGVTEKFGKLTNSLKTIGEQGEQMRDGLKAITEGIKYLSKALMMVSKIPEESVNILDNFLKNLTKRFETLDFKKIQEGGVALKTMAQGIAVFGLALAASAIVYAIAAVGSLIIIPMIAAYSYLFYLVGKGGKEIQEGSKGIGLMGLSLIAFALGLFAVKMIAGGDWGEYAKGALIVMAGIAIFSVAFYFVGKFAEEIQEGAKALAWGGLALIALALGIATFQLFKIDIGSVLMAGAAVAVTGLAFGLIGLFSSYIQQGAVAIAFAGISLIILALGLASFRLLGLDWDELFKTVGIVAIVGAAFAGVGLFSPFIFLGAAALIVAGFAMLTLALGLAAINAVYTKAEKLLGPSDSDPETTNLDVVISGVADAFFINPVKSAFMLLGAAALLVASVALLTLSAGILAFNYAYNKSRNGLLGPSPEDPEVLMIDTVITGIVSAFYINPVKSVFMMLGAAALIVASVALMTLSGGLLLFNFMYKKVQATRLFEASKDDEDVSNFEYMMDAIVDGLVIGPLRLMGLYLAVPAWMMAGFALMSIGSGVVKFAKLVEKNIDINKIGDMIATVLTAVIDVFVSVGNGDIVDWDDVEDGIESVSEVGNLITGIAEGLAKMAELKFPIYDKDGSITGYFSVGDKQFEQVSKNMKLIISTIAGTLTEIGAAQGNVGWFSQSNAEKGADAIRGIGQDLVGLADFVQKAANLTFPIYDKDGKEVGKTTIDPKMLEKGGSVYRNIVAMIKSVTGALGEIGSGEAAQSGWFIDSDIEKGKEAISGVSKDLNGIAQMVQSIATVKNFKTVEKNIKRTLILMPSAMLEAAVIIDKNAAVLGKTGNRLSRMAEHVNSIVDVLVKIQEKGVTDKTADVAGRAIKGIFNGFATFVNVDTKAIGEAVKLLERMARIADPMEKLSNSFVKIAKTMGSFGTTFRKMNLQAMKTFDMLIGSLVVFAKVDPNAFNTLGSKAQALYNFVYEKPKEEKAPTQPEKSNVVTETPGNKKVPVKKPTSTEKAQPDQTNQKMMDLMDELNTTMGKMTNKLGSIENLLMGTIKVQQV